MTNAFTIRGLKKQYKNFVLGPVDLELAPGTVLAYVGPNGSGKSTTMHCQTGLVRPDSGSIEIFGRENDLNKPEWKLDVGYVGDIHCFYENWSGQKNLNFLSDFYPDWSHQRAETLAQRFRLNLNEKAKNLSTGDRAKLAIIAALAHWPRLLILDEPTAGLDPVVRTEVLDVFFEFMEDGERAIFISTHILSDISRLADELAFLDNGRITRQTAKDDLTDKWRRITFQFNGNTLKVDAAVVENHEGRDHQVISTDHEKTLKQLGEIGAENIQQSRMSIDEIAVQILKDGHNVAAN